jgi:membrane protein required for beta-lactamase induction
MIGLRRTVEKPFFFLMIIIYMFGAATVLMFLLYGLVTLSLVSGVVWILVIAVSIGTTGMRFYKQSVARGWPKSA